MCVNNYNNDWIIVIIISEEVNYINFNTKLFNILLSLFTLTTSLYAMDRNEKPARQYPNSTLNRFEPLSETEKKDIEELKTQYYLPPHPFRLKVTIKGALPNDMYPIGITFTRDPDTPRTILLTNALSEFPENIRLPGHEDKRLPCSWYCPDSTRLSYDQHGWKDEKWVNLFEEEEPKLLMQNLKSSYAEYFYPMVIIYGVDTPASPDDIITFQANNKTAYDLYLDPILKSNRGDYHITLKLENFQTEDRS